MQSHWEKIYSKATISQLGWYEADPEPSLRLIDRCGLTPAARILQVGAGATTLVDKLLAQGFQKLIVNDISATALHRLQDRLGEDSKRVRWVIDDLSHPWELLRMGKVDVWHDRAVLHFFTDKEDQDTYFDLVHQLVRPGGYVIIAAFALDGAKKCSGLPVYRYNQEMLQKKLGPDFGMMEAFDYTYHMPSGDIRAYIYTLFQRKKHE